MAAPEQSAPPAQRRGFAALSKAAPLSEFDFTLPPLGEGDIDIRVTVRAPPWQRLRCLRAAFVSTRKRFVVARIVRMMLTCHASLRCVSTTGCATRTATWWLTTGT
jgi:hypothetical protein